jgi:hypothetical protein
MRPMSRSLACSACLHLDLPECFGAQQGRCQDGFADFGATLAAIFHQEPDQPG